MSFRSCGGAAAPPSDAVADACRVGLVQAVRVLVRGEFPSYEVLQCYSIFRVSTDRTRSLGQRAAEEASAALASSVRIRLMRLAALHELDADKLCAQYARWKHLPKMYLAEQPELGNFQAWMCSEHQACL